MESKRERKGRNIETGVIGEREKGGDRKWGYRKREGWREKEEGRKKKWVEQGEREKDV